MQPKKTNRIARESGGLTVILGWNQWTLIINVILINLSLKQCQQ